MNFVKLAFFFALTILFQVSIQAQDWVSYQSQQQVNDLVDTGEELLMATDAGLVVMNKLTLEKTIFNKANSNLSNDHIQRIVQTSDGGTYIGTYDLIIMRFDGSDFQDPIFPESNEYNEDTQLYDFEIAPNGDLWMGTTDGVFHKQGETWLHYDHLDIGNTFFEAWDIAINEAGEVYIGSSTIHRLVDGIWSDISDTTQLFGYVRSDLFFSRSGDLYFAGDLNRIGRFDGEKWQEYDDFDGAFNGSEVTIFTEDVDGNIYFSTLYDGVFKLVDNTWTQQVDAQTEAFNNKISYLYIDDQNHLWLNSNIHLSVNKNGMIESTLLSQHTIEVNNVYNLSKGNNGYLYFLTASDNSISVIDSDGNWSFLTLPTSAMTWENFRDILVLGNNDIWLSSNNGLYHFDGNEWTFNNLEACNRFAVDAQGKIYVSASSGIYIIENNAITEYNVDNSPISALIISGLGIDKNDDLWIASFSWEGDNTIQKVSTDGTWTTYTGIDHPAIDGRPGGDFHFDDEGNVWIPSDQIGAIKFDGTSFTNPLKENMDEITNPEVSSIKSDAMGKLYFSHQYGVTTFFDNEWDNLIIEEVPTNFSFFSNIEFDDKGTLWWASNRYGVFSYSSETSTAVKADLELPTDHFSVYPNPAHNYSVLDFTTQEKANVQVSIYNQLGQLQSDLDLGQLPAGTFQQVIPLADFSKGFYNIQLQIDHKSFTKVLMVQ